MPQKKSYGKKIVIRTLKNMKTFATHHIYFFGNILYNKLCNCKTFVNAIKPNSQQQAKQKNQKFFLQTNYGKYSKKYFKAPSAQYSIQTCKNFFLSSIKKILLANVILCAALVLNGVFTNGNFASYQVASSLYAAENTNILSQNGGYVISNSYKLPSHANYTNQLIHLSKEMYESRSKTIFTKIKDSEVFITLRKNTLLEINPSFFVKGAHVKQGDKIFDGIANFFIQFSQTFYISDKVGNPFITLHANIDEDGPTITLLPLTKYKDNESLLIFGQNGKMAIDVRDEISITKVLIYKDKKLHAIYKNTENAESEKTASISGHPVTKKWQPNTSPTLELNSLTNNKNAFRLTVVASDSLGNSSTSNTRILVSTILPSVDVFVKTDKKQNNTVNEEIKILQNYIVDYSLNPSFYLSSDNNNLFYAIAEKKEYRNKEAALLNTLNFKPYHLNNGEPLPLKINAKQTLYFYAENMLGNNSPIKKVTLDASATGQLAKKEAFQVQ